MALKLRPTALGSGIGSRIHHKENPRCIATPGVSRTLGVSRTEGPTD